MGLLCGHYHNGRLDRQIRPTNR